MKTQTLQKRNKAGRGLLLAGTGLLLAGLTSCGTGTSVRPSTGASMIDAVAKRDGQTRVRNSRVISVNGAGKAGKAAHVAAGLTEVKVRYNWPQGGSQEVDLCYLALKDRKYYVKYAAFPPSVDKLRGTTALSTGAAGFARAGNSVIESAAGTGDPFAAAAGAAIGTVAYTPGILLGTVDYWSRVGADIADKRKAAQWVDVMVISEKQSEGVVRFVRVYPSGKVVWQPWDACSNAPGNPQRGRAVNRPAEAGSVGRASEGEVFRRHQMVR